MANPTFRDYMKYFRKKGEVKSTKSNKKETEDAEPLFQTNFISENQAVVDRARSELAQSKGIKRKTGHGKTSKGKGADNPALNLQAEFSYIKKNKQQNGATR